ncbi:MAG: hypothetical protein ACLTMW_02735 [Blautia hydrogenotrophica]
MSALYDCLTDLGRIRVWS